MLKTRIKIISILSFLILIKINVNAKNLINKKENIDSLDLKSDSSNKTSSLKVNNLDEIIVTGVFDAKSKMKSSVAVTTLDEQTLSKQVSVSYADMLKSVPGVFVNSSLGEIRNIVYSRGISGSAATDAAEGTYYISLQEDGLPVTMGAWQNYNPDYFLRPDITVDKVEAVRGGSSAITSANAPGGIFNYVSKTGGDKHSFSVRQRLGLQSESFMYTRTELNAGGPLGKNTYYNVGGFYRYDEGNRYGGYPLNNGYQLKGNLLKKFNDGGSLMVHAKWLDDQNGWYEFLPAVNFDNPTLANGVSSKDLYQLPSTTANNVPYNSNRNTFSYNPGQQIKNKEFAMGANYKQDLGNGWKIENNMKMSVKNRQWEGSGFSFAAGIDNAGVTHLFTGTAANAGTLNFKDRGTGAILASATVDSNQNIKVTNGAGLPGQDILKNGVVTGLGLHYTHDVTEVMNNFIINKKIEKLHMSFSGGFFYSEMHMTGKEGFGAFGWTKLQSKPELLDVELIAAKDGRTYKFTDPQSGLGYLGGSGWKTFETKMTDIAYFFGHNWDITKELNLDWGIRYEEIRYKGTNYNNKAASYKGLTDGGLDGNVLTQYDNMGTSEGVDYFYDKTMPTYSFTAALSYQFNNNFAVYTRFSNGKKSPSLKPFLDGVMSATGERYEPVAQNIQQIEAGFKFKYDNFNFVATPFYSELSNFGTATIVADDNGAFYTPPPTNNSIRTFGLELEGLSCPKIGLHKKV